MQPPSSADSPESPELGGLAEDLARVPADKIRDTGVFMTVVGGRAVFEG